MMLDAYVYPFPRNSVSATVLPIQALAARFRYQIYSGTNAYIFPVSILSPADIVLLETYHAFRTSVAAVHVYEYEHNEVSTFGSEKRIDSYGYNVDNLDDYYVYLFKRASVVTRNMGEHNAYLVER